MKQNFKNEKVPTLFLGIPTIFVAFDNFVPILIIKYISSLLILQFAVRILITIYLCRIYLNNTYLGFIRIENFWIE